MHSCDLLRDSHRVFQKQVIIDNPLPSGTLILPYLLTSLLILSSSASDFDSVYDRFVCLLIVIQIRVCFNKLNDNIIINITIGEGIKVMGNKQCKQCKQTELQSQAYGGYQIIQIDNTAFASIEKLIQCDSDKLRTTIENQLEMRKQINNPHIVRLLDYQLRPQRYGLKAVMQYQYIPKTLQDRVNDLFFRSQEFTERQLFSIIYGVESGLQELLKNNIRHCCINMQTIMLKNKLYKITDVSSTTYITSYDLVIKGDRNQFLSEKMLNSIYNKSLNPQYELKDDLFSLGMVVLAAAVSQHPTYFYNWNSNGQGMLLIKNLDASIRLLQKKYSSKLVKKIKWLIFNAQNELCEQETNLTENLLSLDEQISRVINKAKEICKKNKSQHETTVGTPEKRLSNSHFASTDNNFRSQKS